MDTLTVIFKALEVLPRFMPQPKPPTFDYSSLRQYYPHLTDAGALATEVKVEAPIKTESPVINIAPKTIISKPQKEEDVSTSCMSCSRSHLSTVSGALNEALRFARDEGMGSTQVQKRLMKAEDEINVMERFDLSAEAIQNSPEKEQELARAYLPRIRKLRQEIGQTASVEALEKTSAEASVLGQEFRLSLLQAKGVDLNPILSLAKRVQAGEISLDDAKAQLKQILPEEE